jgi:hypothetical protein
MASVCSRTGARVEYDAERSDKGWKALRVIRAAEPEITVVRQQHQRSPRR